MKKLIVASNNSHKIEEIKEILSDLNVNIVSLKEEGIDVDVVEDGTTFLENSYKKSATIAEYLKNKGEKDFMVMADDSGIAVDYLNGEPGVYSARYAGVHGNDSENNKKLLKNMEGVPTEKRTARFVCAIVLITSTGKTIKVEGKTEGLVTEEIRGKESFGYDPLFFVPEFNKTFAEMSAEEKNSISHRGRALEKLKEEMLRGDILC